VVFSGRGVVMDTIFEDVTKKTKREPATEEKLAEELVAPPPGGGIHYRKMFHNPLIGDGISIVDTAPVILGCTIIDDYFGIGIGIGIGTGIDGDGMPTINGCRVDANEDGNVSRWNND
jgi:hypothetical protein